MILNSNLVPPGGFTFVDSDGVTHAAKSWPHLVRVVAQYRALNGKSPGDPAREITAVVCASNPSLCLRGGPDPLVRSNKDAFHLRVLNWMLRLVAATRKGEISFVDGVVARERADICRKCLFQQGWEKDCATCQGSVKAVRRQIVGGREEFGRGLLGCLVLAEDTMVSVHTQGETVKEDKLPAYCWRKKK